MVANLKFKASEAEEHSCWLFILNPVIAGTNAHYETHISHTDGSPNNVDLRTRIYSV